MNFDLDEDQSLLKSAVERFARDRYGGDIARRRGYRMTATGFSPENWAALADLGLLALPFATADGGLGGGAIELIAVFEALGRGLVVEPLLDSIIVAGGLLDRAGTDAQRAAWLPGIIAGTKRLALAHAETAARYNLAHVETRAATSGDSVRLSGVKTFVLAAAGADALIVSATEAGTVSFYLVPVDTPGLSIQPFRVVDGSIGAEVALRDVCVPASARLRHGLDALDTIVAQAALAASAEMLGLMTLLLDTTLDYVNTRQQFGTPLGKFQVIQHRLADAYMGIENARSALYRAAIAAPDPRAAAGAKALISEAAITVGHTAIQLHGGMGMTDELLIGHAHKRIMLLAHHFGDARATLDRYLDAA